MACRQNRQDDDWFPSRARRGLPGRANQFWLSEIMSSPSRKNILLFRRPKSGLLIHPSHPTRGVAHVTNARWDAMDATASGAQGIAGRNELRERLSGARTNDAANCLRRNSLGWVRGPAGALARRARTGEIVLSRRPDAGAKSCGDASGPTGLEMYRQSARRRWQKCKAHRGGHV